jgi:beta-1,4-N-acetylglucosaminyltransferase
MASSKSIFVTVGTTRFDALVESATTERALDWMVSQKYTRLIIQYGKGKEPHVVVNDTKKRPLEIELYDFKSSLEPDMRNADLILSHAGAGTIMEAMRLKKHLVVVINTALMNNHQTELAHALGSRKYLYVVDEPKQLQREETWKEFRDFVPLPYEPGDEHDFPRLLDSFLGYTSKNP